MSAPLTREYLDEATCSDCGREHPHELYLHSRCHPEMSTWVSYAEGVLTVTCALCGETVATIAVAREEERRGEDTR